MDILRIGARLLRAGLTCAGLAFASAAIAGETGFTGSLSPRERASSGLDSLTPVQRSALDRLVARDVALAHEGRVTGFAGTFTARRTPAERTAAGIDRLTDPQRASLDGLAAREIAFGPPPSDAFTYSPPAAPVIPASLVRAPALVVHGDVSLTVGGGSHGSSFYGTSTDLFVSDPSGRFTLAVGVAAYRGRGFFPLIDPVCDLPPYRDAWIGP